MATNAKPLYLKSGSIRSVYGREVMGFDENKLMTVQETDPQNNSSVIIAPVFGTQGANAPPNSIVEQLDRIIGHFETNDTVIQSALICWSETIDMKFGVKVILIDTSEVRPEIPQSVKYLFNDSVFPVLMTANHKPIPLQNIYDDLPNGYTCGLYLALVQKDNVESNMRSVIFMDNPTNTTVSRCPTYSAILISYKKSAVKSTNQVRLISRVLERHCRSCPVWGVFAPINSEIFRVTTDCNTFPVLNQTKYLSDRSVFLVSNDGLLSITETFLDKTRTKNSFFTSLLKEDTFCCCEGVLRTETVYNNTMSYIGNWTFGLPYKQLIVIVGEGLHTLQISIYDCRSLLMGKNQLINYVYGLYTIRDFNLHNIEFDWIKVSKDLTNTTQQYSIEPVMRLDCISDAFIYEYRHNNKTVGHLVFSLSKNYFDRDYFKDTFNVFIALDDTNWSADDSLYHWVCLCNVNYNKSSDIQTMLPPEIIIYQRYHHYMELPNLLDNHHFKWTLNGSLSNPVYENRNNWRKLFLPTINTAELAQFRNVGTNLIERLKAFQKFGFRFPNNY